MKPFAAYNAIREGIPEHEKTFWQSYSVDELHALYVSLSATPLLTNQMKRTYVKLVRLDIYNNILGT